MSLAKCTLVFRDIGNGIIRWEQDDALLTSDPAWRLGRVNDARRPGGLAHPESKQACNGAYLADAPSEDCPVRRERSARCSRGVQPSLERPACGTQRLTVRYCQELRQ